MLSKDKEITESANSPQSTETIPTWKKVWDNIQVLSIALILALLIRVFIAEPRYIPSDSMLPTLEQGDRLVVEKLSYYFHPPQFGDIIVFEPPTQLQMQGYQKDQAFIKRVIGVSGDQIVVKNNQVYINNQLLEEPYIAESPNYELLAVQVPNHYLFVMGDNRNNSNDSHIWGFLPETNVIGRAKFRFWPFNRFGTV